uniref:Choline/carnitine acyltransferase domain-containing protein n=1 Tax=Panagrolaimus sp. PS1159 TaxID=55785 RepID=A0AC35FGN7_9BILA
MCLVHIREYIKYHEKYSNPHNHDGHCRGKIEIIRTAGRNLLYVTLQRIADLQLNAEHSCVDAMCLVHIREYIKYHEKYSNPHNHDGHCHGKIETIPTAGRLIFNLDNETKDAIDGKVSKVVADNFENAYVVFRDFGKDFILKKGSRIPENANFQSFFLKKNLYISCSDEKEIYIQQS